MNKKKKILVIASTFPTFIAGDATPPFVYELSKRLVKQFDIYVLAPYSFGTKTFQEEDGLLIHRYKYWFGKNNLADGAILPNLKKNKLLYFQIPFFYIFQLLAIMKLCKKYKIDTIHAHWIIPQGFIAVLYKKIFNRKIKILCTTHGTDIFGLNGKLGILFKKYTLKNIDKLTVVSNAIKEEVSKLTERNIEVLPMGIDTNMFSPKMESKSLRKRLNINGIFLLYVGRLSEMKGIKYLIQAMPEIIENYNKTKLVIVGDGEERKVLEELTKEFKIENNVIFTGWINYLKLPTYFATADIFIGPSIKTKNGYREGFGLTFAESISSKCVAIASDLPAIKDIIIDNQTGFIVKQRSPKSIANKVINLIKNEDKLKTIKDNGRDYAVKNFDWKTISMKYGKLLE